MTTTSSAMDGLQLPDDEVGEVPSMFIARIVPPSGTDTTVFATLLEQYVHREAAAIAGSHTTSGYIWDRESPTVQLDDEDPSIVTLSMRVQDCIDDEWFLTYLLRGFTHTHDACISVRDEDGEFLLIEASDELPTWVTPDNADNRVWIYQGELHLIPLTAAPSDTTLSVSDALRLIRDESVTTRVSGPVQQRAFSRLDAYPQAAADHHHTTLAFVPISVAKVLTTFPQRIADAVHALTTRDPVSVRSAQKPTFFGVEGMADQDMNALPATDVVLTPIRCTRHLYAQLSFDRYFPPSAFGKRWQRYVEMYRIAMAGKATLSEKQLAWGRWCDIGAKIAGGLEMWLHNLGASAASMPSRPGSHIIPSDKKEAFLHALTKLGYFGKEIRDSARWKVLEERALTKAAQLSSSLRTESIETPTFSTVKQVLREPANENIVTLLPTSELASLQSQEDSDAWLNVAPDDIEAMFARHAPQEAEEATMDKFQAFMTRMQSFIDGQGDVEGALFEDEDFEDGEEADADLTDSDASGETRQQRMDSLVEGVPLSEWGAENASKASIPSDLPPKHETLPKTAHPPTSSFSSRQRLRGLSTLDRMDGDSDSDPESLHGDEDDAADERAERHRFLELEDDDMQSEMNEEGDGIQMDQEMDDFLEFTRRTLGLSESQYAAILEEREKRGGTWHANLPSAFVPSSHAHAKPQTSSKSQVPLDSFDAVLDAMEKELMKERAKNTEPKDPTDMEEGSDEELNEEEQELLQQLLASGGFLPESLRHFAQDSGASSMEVDALSHFLESFKAQEGRPGPVGTLSARLGVGALPRDAEPPDEA